MAKRCKHHIGNVPGCAINYGLGDCLGRCRGVDNCNKFEDVTSPTQIALGYQGSNKTFVVDIPCSMSAEEKKVLTNRLNEILESVAFFSSKDTRASVRHQIKMALGL